jgi:aerobic carbon-monoxide dehydrogenase medium subunit
MSSAFTIEEPRSVDETLEMLGAGDESVRLIAGGSGLALLMKYGFFEPTTLISLRHLAAELSSIDLTASGGVHLGAMATLRDLEDAPAVAERLPLLHQALKVLATIRLRNVAQLGGAIAHGHPQMDLPPVLLALDAKVRVRGHRGDRWIDAADLFLGYYDTAVEDDELITDVVVEPPGEHRASYRKVTARAADDWPMLGVAALATTRDGEVGELRVAVGALTDRAQRLPAVEALAGQQVSPEIIAEAAVAGADSIDYQASASASSRYQRHLVAVHLRRALHEVLDEPERWLGSEVVR